MRLVTFLHEQETRGPQRIAVAGNLTSSTRLYNGTAVPAAAPNLRGMLNRNVESLLEEILKAIADQHEGAGNPRAGEDQRQQIKDRLQSYLDRFFHELRNTGTGSHDRALNFAAATVSSPAMCRAT